ncbi:4312_t:CDS:2 [Ambispora gerdemannii]|uniref:4312_t:CDS:1 n=1 Tax=Ambispora gerdemannii TaxID=144530 RepID=A0A9N8ZG43_9GLOM|nr:4312_t:CDS:2 [Ambispora gerdemannii]
MHVNQDPLLKMFPEQIPYEQFQNLRVFGSGGYSTVISAIWKDGPRVRCDKSKKWIRRGPTHVALKRLRRVNNYFVRVRNEAAIHLSIARSRYIIDFYGISSDPTSRDFIFVMQFAQKGSLHDFLEANFNQIQWNDKLKILFGIISGLRKLHENNFIHCDLHSGNILIDQNGRALLTDFGLTIKNEPPYNDLNSLQTLYGVMSSLAPETLRTGRRSKAADIYSIGMLMWELSSGKRPFASVPHDYELIFSICNEVRPCRPSIIEGTPRVYVDLMSRCWEVDPENRPDTKSVYESINEYFSNRSSIIGVLTSNISNFSTSRDSHLALSMNETIRVFKQQISSAVLTLNVLNG